MIIYALSSLSSTCQADNYLQCLWFPREGLNGAVSCPGPPNPFKIFSQQVPFPLWPAQSPSGTLWDQWPHGSGAFRKLWSGKQMRISTDNWWESEVAICWWTPSVDPGAGLEPCPLTSGLPFLYFLYVPTPFDSPYSLKDWSGLHFDRE